MVTVEEFPCNRAVTIPGPVGALEAITACPTDGNAGGTVIVLHPHPLYGGTMDNKVVTTLARGFVELGFASVRFNFRGVGASEGQFADAVGECDDALAVIDWVRRTRPDDAIWLAGFSFGAVVALRIAHAAGVAGLVTVAPAVHLYDLSDLEPPACPWLLIQGEADEVAPVEEVRRWLARLRTPPQSVFLPGVGHFFHQRLNDLRSALGDFIPPHRPR